MGACHNKENIPLVLDNVPFNGTLRTEQNCELLLTKTLFKEDPFISSLLYATLKDTPKFIPKLTTGVVLKVYDGDTITVASRINNIGKIWKWSVRLRNIDCPEIRSGDEQEKKIAIIAKTTLKNRLMPNDIGQIVELRDIDYDKYGRILCDVYHCDQHLNKWMIDQHLAVKYDGGTKQKVNWTEYYSSKSTNSL